MRPSVLPNAGLLIEPKSSKTQSDRNHRGFWALPPAVRGNSLFVLLWVSEWQGMDEFPVMHILLGEFRRRESKGLNLVSGQVEIDYCFMRLLIS